MLLRPNKPSRRSPSLEPYFEADWRPDPTADHFVEIHTRRYHTPGRATLGGTMFDRCPTPKKRGYFHKSAALLAADKLRCHFESEPYLCECGRYHLTTNNGRNAKGTKKRHRG